VTARPARRARDDRELPAVAAALARSVRSGAGLVDAFDEVAATVVTSGSQLCADLGQVTAWVARGVRVDDALQRWSDRSHDPAVALLVAACRFGHAHGGDLAAALDGAAVALLDQLEAADEARALASQARTSAGVLVALPILGAAGFSLLDPRVARTLLTTPAGLACLVTGTALEAAGAWVLSRMVRSALR
jgi:tight adherence protein B